MNFMLLLGMALFTLKMKRLRQRRQRGLRGLGKLNPWISHIFWDKDRQCWKSSRYPSAYSVRHSLNSQSGIRIIPGPSPLLVRL